MSLDITLTAVRPVTVFDANVTHNLCAMAKEAGVYDCVWHPHEHGIAKAAQLVEPIRAALVAMAVDPERFIALNPANGWGAFVRFVPWLERLLAACEANPDADVSARG